MTFINLMAREINCKIVYYGPGLCGKTTNLQHIFDRTREDARGKMVSLATETDRTLFFDFLPLELGQIRGFKTRFHLYTVPGQVFYDASRKLILKGVDGCVFVADSQMARVDANEESLDNLRSNLEEYGINLDEIPWVMQYNKRDLPGVLPVEELRATLNPTGVPEFEAVACDGTGVFETLKAVAKLVFTELKKSGPGGPSASPGASPPVSSTSSSRAPSSRVAAPPPPTPIGRTAPPPARTAPARTAPPARPAPPPVRPTPPQARPAPPARPAAPRRPAPPPPLPLPGSGNRGDK